MKFQTTLLFSLTCLIGTTFAQSFDCRKATTPVEYAVCEDKALGNLDSQLAKEFAKGKKISGSEWVQEQKEWLQKRDKSYRTGTNESLAELYRKRISEVKAVLLTKFKNSSGKYEIPHTISMYDPGSQTYSTDKTNDVFTFNWKSSDEVAFSVSTIVNNANMCDIDGVAKADAHGRFIWKANSSYGIELYPDSGWWYFKLLPGSNQCEGCGLNAYIYNIRFKHSGSSYVAQVLEK